MGRLEKAQGITSDIAESNDDTLSALHVTHLARLTLTLIVDILRQTGDDGSEAEYTHLARATAHCIDPKCGSPLIEITSAQLSCGVDAALAQVALGHTDAWH